MHPTLDPTSILRELISRDPVKLTSLPKDEHGIFALYDHTRAIRYFGITEGDRQGFFGRINGWHVNGSATRSHKFSHAYNNGRMFRFHFDTSPDARLAKKLRSSFARRYCAASFLTVSPELHSDLPALESAVQALAPAEMMTWGRERGFAPGSEPTELVDALLDELHFSAGQRTAVERQAAMRKATWGRAHTPE